MKGIIICVFAMVMLTLTQGVEEEQPEQLVESEGSEEDEEHLECFRCDLGFWDACYTTETNCSRGELCYTGRGKAVDALDIKTLGCVKAEECDVETTVELFPNGTIFAMTKHCCDTPYCNSAHQLPTYTLLYLTALISQYLTVLST
ncbi:protein Bouncer isoform X2 [Oryzias melastigma]|uniref:Sperm acrosome membrane-associated protein 4-like n=1 Tax=Oryzias melastigma TaxID=30732 RepID=A0A3B3D452_ORYME|nr:protein Bouncer isoform X2 [Oryzias melastigma]